MQRHIGDLVKHVLDQTSMNNSMISIATGNLQ